MPTKSDSGKTSRPRIVLLMGAPGSGKGTQTTWLSNQLGLASLSTGEILRAEAKRNTPAGFMLRQTLASGALVNDETVCELVGAKLRRERNGNGLILDGFPRNVQQAEFLARLVEELGYNRPAVLHLDVSKEDLLRR